MICWLRAKFQYLYSALRRGKVDREIDDELRFHLEMTIEQNLAAGMSSNDATRDAVERFGSLPRISESGRELRRGNLIDSLWQDLRTSVRLLRKHPAFSSMLILTMALGIGSNVAVFSVVDSVLLKPLPYKNPRELTLIWSSFQQMGASRAPSAGTQLQELHDRSHLFKDIAGIWVGNGTFSGEPEPEQVKIGDVTPNFFSVLGVSPILGRTFQPQTSGGGPAEVMLTHGLWQRRFGSDAAVVGKSVRINGNNFTVVGVMPADFALTFPPDANVPATVQAYVPFQENIYQQPRDLYYIRLLARMKPGVTIDQAQSDANAVAGQLRTEFAEYYKENLQFQVVELHHDIVRDIRPALIALFIGAALVLLICSFNVANLLLAQASMRRKEIALRLAIGASRQRVARQVVSETLLICGLGGVLGLLIGWIGLKLLLTLRPESLSRVSAGHINWTVLAFVVITTIGAGLLSSLAPLLQLRKLKLIEPLKEEGRLSSGRVKNRMRTLLMVSETALGFVLLVGAGLMIRTLVQLHRVSPGFNASHVLSFEMIPAGRQASARTQFVQQCESALASLSGVQSVGAISHLPLDDYPNWYSAYAPEGFSLNETRNLLADHRAVTAGYFEAIGARLLAGRYFDNHDDSEGRRVVIVDDVLAQQTWPSESPIGKKLEVEHFTENGFVNQWSEVIGVVAHIKNHNLLRVGRGEIYIPYAQSAREHLSFVVRASQDPTTLAAAVRREITKIDKTRAIAKVRPMDDYVQRALAATNFTTVLASVFAILALLLATVGVYAVVSYSVSQRSHEMGVRIALGARPRDILNLVLKEGLSLAMLGIAMGLVATLFLASYLSSLLFEVKPFDPLTYLVMALMVPLATLLACWRPARKASLDNPIDALRR